MTLYRFEPLHGRDVQEGDSREVQDQAVDVHSGNTDVSGKLAIPIHLERRVLVVSGQIHLPSARLISLVE